MAVQASATIVKKADDLTIHQSNPTKSFIDQSTAKYCEKLLQGKCVCFVPMFILRPSMNEASSPQIQASSSVSDTAIHHHSVYVIKKLKRSEKDCIYPFMSERILNIF
jgi:hypothetical protein